MDLGGYTLDQIVKKIKQLEYSKNDNEGFIINEVDESKIFLTFIYSSPTYITKLDEEKLEVIKEKIIIKNIVDFSIDTKLKILSIFNASNSSRKLITELGKLTDFKITIDDINFNLKDILNKTRIMDLHFELTSMRIRNFQITDEICGTYWIKITNPNVIKKFLNEYSGELIFINGHMKIRENEIGLGFYENGTISISDIEGEFEGNVDRMKQLLFNEGV